MTDWRRVTRRQPCIVCGHGDWCCITADGELIYCMRVQSDKSCLAGGWFHWAKPDDPKPRIPPPQPTGPPPDFSAEVKGMQGHAAEAAIVHPWAEQLGVTANALARLGIGYHEGKQIFPMKNAEAAITGVRIRDPESGDKWCIKGSREGLFIPQGFDPRKAIVIVEGPTDCAAALDLGFNAVGRPSCVGGLAILCEVVRKYKTPRCLIIIDNDVPATRPDGSTWRPGTEGANTLMNELSKHCMNLSLVEPPEGIKDLRQWKQQGITKQTVLDCMAKEVA